MAKGRKPIKKYGKKAAALFEFPPEVVLGGVNLSVFENMGCVIENYEDILSYSGESIRIKTRIGTIRLEGKNFNIEVMTTDSISVTGEIATIVYENFGG